MSKTLKFQTGNLPIGEDNTTFQIYHTSVSDANTLASGVTKANLDAGYNIAGIDDDKFTFVIFNSASSATVTAYLPPPTIANFTPQSGETGDTIQITGSGFVGYTAVTFGGTAASSANVFSNTSMSAVVAGGSTGQIKVSNPRGNAFSTRVFQYVDPSGTIYYLGQYYRDLNDSSIVCSQQGTVFDLFIQGYNSLNDALGTAAVVYRDDPDLGIQASPGYYGLKQAVDSGGEDVGLWFYINSAGNVTEVDLCSQPPVDEEDELITRIGGIGGGPEFIIE